MGAHIGGSSGGGIPDPAVKATNDGLIYNGSAWVAQKVQAANIADLAVGTAKLADLGITLAKLAAGAVDNSKIAAAAGIAVSKLAAGSEGQSIITTGGNVVWSTPAGGAPSGAAGGDLTGTYPNPGIIGHHARHEPNGSDAIDWTGKIHLEGLEANLPAAAAGNAGATYWATDSKIEYRSTGSAWTGKAFNRKRVLNGTGLFTTCDREDADGNLPAGTSGVTYLHALYIPRGITLTTLAFLNASTGATFQAGSSHQVFSLYDSGGNLLCYSGDDTNTAWGANTWKELAIAKLAGGASQANFVTTYSGVYYLGYMVNVGTGTMPTRRARDLLVQGVSNPGGASGSSKLVVLSTSGGTAGAATPPATITVTSGGAAIENRWQLGYARSA